MKLVECVPNVSEGRDRGVLDRIAAAIEAVDGVELLDMDPGEATHRTVFTFVGNIEAVERAAVELIVKAASLIDMRRHRGAHPRMGATDVCPFVPIGETTMEECVELARRVGRVIGEKLKLPVYLYEEAATKPERRSLANVRQGEYEGLPEKLGDPEWAPDFGPAVHNERSGATAVGARQFLIAYNVNLNTTDRRLAHRVAQNVRETGRPKRDSEGAVVKDAQGRTVMEPGDSQLPAVRGTGWYIEEYGRAQVSMNLMDFRTTSMEKAFEAVSTEAAKRGLRVTGSEIVGLIPLDALLSAGRFYLERQGRTPSVSESELVRTAILSLGLDELCPFEPEKKIIEYRVAPHRPLGEQTLQAFADSVAAGVPVPGGGSVAAMVGALSGALTAMVASISSQRRDLEEHREEFVRLGRDGHAVKSALLGAVDGDASAYERVMTARRLPRRTDQEREARDKAIQEATLGAIEAPLSVMRQGVRAGEIAAEIARKGASSALSDAGVAALAAAAAVEGAAYNVAINLGDLTDREAAARLEGEALRLRKQAAVKADETTRRLREVLDADN